MSKFVKLCACTLVLIGAALAADPPPAPGSIVVNQVLFRLDAIAGEENCTFLGPVEQNILVACFVDDQERELHDYRPIAGGPAITGDFDDINNKISWSIRRDGDKFLWEIHANGVVQSGQF